MTPRDVERIFELTLRADARARSFFDLAETALPRGGIESPLRLAHFLAQILHESKGLTKFEEDLHYRAERLTVVWPRIFPTVADAEPYHMNPRALANYVYGKRLASKLGNIDEEDGWMFRGMGLIHITGRFNYRRVGQILGINLEIEPELVTQPKYALAAAAVMWHLSNANQPADRDDIVAVTKCINGGHEGLASRRAWLARVKLALGEAA